MAEMNPGNLMKMNSDEKEQWVEAIRAALPSFADLEVFDQVMPEEVRYMKQEGIHPKRLPARLIL
eukprot:8058490-Prorocentrum_lima.AAC.1